MPSSLSHPRYESAPTKVRADLRRRLLAWFDRHGRDLPWRRRQSDPYAQWVAEIMLQQTRVETVLRYYEKFIRRFPTVDHLARARHETVLKHWEGLGYYRRALLMHRGAGEIHAAGAGMPDSAEALREVSGIGEYTAAAVASIAYNEPVAAVDGNVARVIARLFAIEEDVLSTSGKRIIAAMAGELVARKRPGDFNQAWMDFGNAVCKPRGPLCAACPLAPHCRGYQSGETARFPVRIPKSRVKAVRLAVGHYVSEGMMLVRRRPLGGLWSGLWEFPSIELTGQGNAESALLDHAGDLGLTVEDSCHPAIEVTHQLTHRRMTFLTYVMHVNHRDSVHHEQEHQWVTARAFAKLAVSTAHRKIHRALTTSEPRP
ncbi:MAG: A/G-specific adenine glycosylase [Planctomycetota bacterium]